MWNPLQSLLKSGVTTVGGLPGGAAAAAIDPSMLPALIVVSKPNDARLMQRELAFHLSVPVVLFPEDDARPYDGFSPGADVPRQRLQALGALRSGRPVVVVATAAAMLHKALVADSLRSLTLRRGEVTNRDNLLNTLVTWGYLKSGGVEDVGQVAVRGELVDLWSPGSANPVRLDFFDDEVEGINSFDPVRQRNLEAVSETTVLPAREMVVTPEGIERARGITAEAVDTLGAGHGVRRRVLEALREGLWFPAAEDYLGAVEELVPPWQHAPRLIVVDPDAIMEAAEAFHALVGTRWTNADAQDRPMVLPRHRYVDPETLKSALSQAIRLLPLAVDTADAGARDNDDLRVGTHDLAPLLGRLSGWLEQGWQIAIVGESRASAERIQGLLGPHGVPISPRPRGEWADEGTITLWTGDLPKGFRSKKHGFALISAEDLFGAKKTAPKTPKTLKDAILTDITDLKTGDLVVHVRHGIGRFEGLKRLQVDGGEQDFALVGYRDDGRMYLPVTRFDQLYRYRGLGGAVPRLDKLGGESWERRKAKVKDKILAMAGELLRLHATREVVEGYPFTGSPDLYRQFEETFPFVETPDQQAAIDDVMADLAEDGPMDRLIVGDVGFGKTEVCMRAAMRVVLEGFQVAVLCPTTVLTMQHERSFIERFGDLPVRIASLSRFNTAKENREIQASISKGEIDIVIGTTALLGRRMRFKNLGLAVVDEEHRFGVKQKDKLKKQFPGVEYLAMSATPIPRTLHMALSGLRNVSIIATPPAERLPVRTKVAKFSESRIISDLHRELARGGQAYFVHNRVGSIQAIARFLRRLLPTARIEVAHGQMDERALEEVIIKFMRRDFDVLVCTTIIESGIDLSNVNTMIVNRADTMGLAQLYQLRGRVGRGYRRGYCTLLVPTQGRMHKDAMRRLHTLQENTELGAGFAIASADLEIRGSGNLLGESQSGQIQAVGFDTYVELLEDAVRHARGDLSRARLDPEVEVPVAALLPEEYIDDLDARLHEYRRLAMCHTPAEVRDLVSAWEDRYGEPPSPVLNLGWMAETRVRCRELGIERVSWLKVQVSFQFAAETPIDPAVIAKLVTEEPNRFFLRKKKHDEEPTRLEVRFTPDEATWPFRFIYWVMSRLA